MAVITRIELVNYLCEGWQPSMGAVRWRPLWPANTIRLAGQSTAIQIPNGCGKTSVTNAILFLLSRDRHLKKEFLDRCAPSETGYTHVRIEFAIRIGEDITQRDLITADPLQCPAQTYVIGVCGNRGDDDLQFYRYPGQLEDSPAYRIDDSTIFFTPNEEFRAGTRKLTKADWNRWGTIAEWGRVVGEFMSAEVVRQNVLFHRSGAGDASATFKKVTVEPGERFDEAYFKQIAAPQLLANLMGDSAEEDERSIEDTITISMTRFIDAKLKVERKQSYLEKREEMEAEFAPVLQAAGAIQAAQSNYQRQLQELGRDASLLNRFAGTGGGSLPGVPSSAASVRLSAKAQQCLAGMALDKDGTVVISDEALARSLDQTTGNLNKSAEASSAVRTSVPTATTSAQLIDFERNIKISEGGGGRRKAARHYDRAGALELAGRRPDAVSNADALHQAFDAAEQFGDTNPFRKEHRRLKAEQLELKHAIQGLEQAARDAELLQQSLETQVTERAENQAAYKEFCKHAPLLPEAIPEAPRDAEAWLELELGIRDTAVTGHSRRVGELTAGWKKLLALRQQLGFQTVAERLDELVAQRKQLEDKEERHREANRSAESKRDAQLSLQASTTEALTKARHELASLQALLDGDATFRGIFGDVDPLTMSLPTAELKALQQEFRRQSALREPKRTRLARLATLKVGFAAFQRLFGVADPQGLNPLVARDRLVEEHRQAELIYSQHQPLAEAYEQHGEMHAGLAPTAWIRQADAARAEAERDARRSLARTVDLQRELDALNDLSLVDDASYAGALLSLKDARVSHTRLRDLILATEPNEDRRLSLLSAFGSVLGAPVVDDVQAAESAMQALQAGAHNVPIFLREPLIETLRSGPLAQTPSGAALHLVAGATTRRVRAILDPRALEEEKQAVLADIEKQRKAKEDADARAVANGPHSDAYTLAQRAAEAAKLDSVVKATKADLRMRELAPQLERARALTAEEALRSLSEATEFMELGANVGLAELEGDVGTLSADIVRIETRIGVLEGLTSPEAAVAYDTAVRLAKGGGFARVAALEAETDSQSSAHREGCMLLRTLEGELATAALTLEQASKQGRSFMEGYELTLRDLKNAVEFEKDGSAAFMETKDEVGTTLDDSRDALKPLARVNLVRAQSYKDNEGEDEAALQRRIGEAWCTRETSTAKAREFAADVQRLEGLLVASDRAAETLHELAHFLVDKHLAVAPYLNDLAEREGGVTPAESHPMYARAEELRHRLIDWRHVDGPFDRTLLTAMRSEIENIDVAKSGVETREAKKRADRVRDQFRTQRDAFCAKAAGKEGAALSQAEIEAIQAANSIEQLIELARLGERLREDLAQEHAGLQELQKAAETVESESIDILSRLVESCRANLATMNTVMARNPNARFFIETTIIGSDDIKKLLTELRDGIEERKRAAESKTSLGRKDRDDSSIRADVRRALIDRIFTEPSVQFRHVGMWDGKTQPLQSSLSEGQKAALQMMWLIKESEYHLECAVRRHLGGGSKKKLRNRSQRILFFDGLFSNLTDRTLIDEAFKGLGDTGSNLQLIGLIHNPEYRNNPDIFPSLVVGRRAGWREVNGERSFVRFDDGRPNGSLGLATFMVKGPALKPGQEGPNG